jgi:hypothetical protein
MSGAYEARGDGGISPERLVSEKRGNRALSGMAEQIGLGA